MAQLESKWYGEKGPFEQISREESWAESKTGMFKVFGKYDDLINKDIKPGTPLSSVPGLDAPSGNWYVRTCTVAREEGDSGTMTVNAVRVMKTNDGKPYNYIWQVSMDAVNKNLITHPHVNEYIEILEKWENTPACYKYGHDKSSGDTKFYYVTGKIISPNPERVEIKEQGAIDYCKAVMAGITSYNIYLPVIIKTTYYLELPGCNYDKDHIVQSGKIKLSDAGEIGNFDTPKILVSCVPSGKGKWLKSMDTITENADGTCTRTEQWTYTNDDKNKWIYEELAK